MTEITAQRSAPSAGAASRDYPMPTAATAALSTPQKSVGSGLAFIFGVAPFAFLTTGAAAFGVSLLGHVRGDSHRGGLIFAGIVGGLVAASSIVDGVRMIRGTYIPSEHLGGGSITHGDEPRGEGNYNAPRPLRHNTANGSPPYPSESRQRNSTDMFPNRRIR